ncbi:hypothetical protein E4U42_003930 [Claviceps africana]|uniref:DUF7029 domain-containing protein n=1 Tax=Claviceps africana TaxID=83212 RepID=A0A8K0J5T0_9HYPO|nr:hypothetical protein E4U42_003930 [Claviceps africana]
MLSVPYTVALFLGVASQIQAARLPRYLPRDETTKQQAAKSATLYPNVHWSYDTKVLSSVLPIEPNKGAELYYGVADPSESGHFAFLTYYFSLPSVNIDHTDHVNVRYDDKNGITASFQNKEAFDHAASSWSAQDGLLIIAHVEGCGAYDQGERCYFSVTELEFHREQLSVFAKGSSKHPDEITISGETEWGWWDAGEGNTATAAASKGALASRSPSSGQAMGHPGCVAPPDAQNGLPTACLGTNFDQSLDEKLGHETLSAESSGYLRQLTSSTFDGFESADLTSSSPIASSRRRGARSMLARRGRQSGVGKFFQRAVDDDKDATSSVQCIGDGKSPHFSFKIPDFESSDSAAWTLLANLTQKESPWGDAVLIATFEAEHELKVGTKSKSLEVYCVDCSVTGQATLTGRAKWSPARGVHGGTVDLSTDLKVVINIGLNGAGSLEKEFELDLFTFGLPGLSYGIVTVGPYLSLSARAVLALESEGTILAGGELDLQGARVVMDFADSNVVDKTGWNVSSFNPTVEAQGKVTGTAELGIPFGLKFGFKVSNWEAAIGVVDEASVKTSITYEGSAGSKPKDAGDEEEKEEESEGGGDEKESESKDADEKEASKPKDASDDKGTNKPKDASDDKGSKKPKGGSDKKGLKSRNANDNKGSKSKDASDKKGSKPKDASDDTGSKSKDASKGSKSKDGSDKEGSDSKDGSDEKGEEESESEDASEEEESKSESTCAGGLAEFSWRNRFWAGIVDPDSDATFDSDDQVFVSECIDKKTLDAAQMHLFKNPRHQQKKTTTRRSIDGKEPGMSSGAPAETKPVQLVNPNESTKMVACDNGNLYAVRNDDSKNAHCSDRWETTAKHSVVVCDAQHRPLHYYRNTMSTLGVSRLRASGEDDVPHGAVAIALVPLQHPEQQPLELVVAVDPSHQVLYPVVCDFVDKSSASKVFLVRDPVQGPAVLRRSDVIHSVTGGPVAECRLLALKEKA